METLDNGCVVVVLGGAEINGTQWQKLDLKQEINTALSAYIASELALKEKKKSLFEVAELSACWLEKGLWTFILLLLSICCVLVHLTTQEQTCTQPRPAYFTVVTCFLLFLLIPQEAGMLLRSASDLRGLHSVNHVKINE